MSPTSPWKVAASTCPTPNNSSRLVLAWATAVLMRASTRDQVHQQPVEPVNGLGAGRDHVLAPLAQQMQPSGF